jgi:hypothetical protein
MDIGFLEGEHCNRNGCKGVIVHSEDYDTSKCICSASHPPCTFCTTDFAICNTCTYQAKDWVFDYDIIDERGTDEKV